MTYRKEWMILSFLFLFLGSTALQAQKKTPEAPHFYLGLDLGTSRLSSDFLYQPEAPELLHHRENQYQARIFGGYAFHPRQAVEASLQLIPSAGGARVSLQDFALVSNVHILNSLALDLGYLYEVIRYKRFRLRLGLHGGLALPLNAFEPGSIRRMGYQGTANVETSFVEITATEKAGAFGYVGGRAVLEYALGANKRSLLSLNAGSLRSLAAIQRFDLRYQRLGSGIRSSQSSAFLANWTFSLGFRYRLLKA